MMVSLPTMILRYTDILMTQKGPLIHIIKDE